MLINRLADLFILINEFCQEMEVVLPCEYVYYFSHRLNHQNLIRDKILGQKRLVKVNTSDE